MTETQPRFFMALGLWLVWSSGCLPNSILPECAPAGEGVEIELRIPRTAQGNLAPNDARVDEVDRSNGLRLRFSLLDDDEATLEVSVPAEAASAIAAPDPGETVTLHASDRGCDCDGQFYVTSSERPGWILAAAKGYEAAWLRGTVLMQAVADERCQAGSVEKSSGALIIEPSADAVLVVGAPQILNWRIFDETYEVYAHAFQLDADIVHPPDTLDGASAYSNFVFGTPQSENE